jgi:hypothetical protein
MHEYLVDMWATQKTIWHLSSPAEKGRTVAVWIVGIYILICQTISLLRVIFSVRMIVIVCLAAMVGVATWWLLENDGGDYEGSGPIPPGNMD